MVYNTQNYWVFGFCPSSGISKLENTTFRKLGVSETLCFLVSRTADDERSVEKSNSEDQSVG
jgi:hypothetical protein